MDCKTTLCDECKEHHPRFPLFRGHRVIQLSEETDTVIDRVVFCQKHTDQTILFNCQECEEPLCITCKVTLHDSHKAETVQDTLERVLPEMKGYCDKIKKLIVDIDDNKDELETRKLEVKVAFEKCRKDAEMQLQKIDDH